MNSLAAEQRQSWLTWFLRAILAILFLILATRLTELQVVKGGYYKNMAEGNRIRRVPITAPRGKIFGLAGQEIVTNREVKKALTFNPNEGYTKVKDLEGVAEEEYITEWERVYSYGKEMAHITGYLGEVNADEVGKTDPSCPEKGPRTLGSFIGRGGLEAHYDCLLKGIDGEELVEVDTMGRKIRVLGRKPPIPGTDIHTTIDVNLQRKVASIMQGKKGAAVITNTNGGVLAFYSEPSYDPNIFVAGKSDNISAIMKDKELPLFNRVTGGSYHPGSVFKLVTALGALEEGVINPSYRYTDMGLIEVNGFQYRNWYLTQYGGTEGEIGLERAMARSTDTFFYEIGGKLGVEKLSMWAKKFGLAEPTGIDIPGETAGLVPDARWKERIKGERWFLGNTYHMAIGQGDLSLTPISVNTMTSAAVSGKLCRPMIRKQSEECKDLGVHQENIDLVIRGMIAACSEGGTAYPFFDFKPQAACKTGTAQTGTEDDTHAWFTIAAPAEKPELIATIMVEEGGEGSRDAAPLAREIFDYYFNP